MTPQQRSVVTLLGFTAAAAAVGLYAYFGVMKGDEKEAAQKESADKLVSGGPAEKLPDGGGPPPPEFTKITVHAKGETTTVEKQPDGTWRMTAPLSAAVDQYVLDALTTQLKDGKVDQKVEAAPTDADLRKYGLQEPAWTVEAAATVQGAPKQVKLAGGAENAFNGSIYLRKDADPAVYSASGGMRFNLEKSSYDLRDKQVLSVDEAKIASIDVAKPKGGYALVRVEGAGAQAWKLTKPKPQDADGQTVINALGQLKNERATAFVADSPEERKKDGLESPALDVTFGLQGGDKVRLRLAKAGGSGGGKPDAGASPSDKYYALREDKNGAVLAEVNASALGHLDKSADDLRDKSVLQFDKDAVAEVSFRPQGGGAPIRVTRDQKKPEDGGAPTPAETWAVAAPEVGPAKAWKVSSNLWTLGSLQATAFDEENPKSWDKYGINDKSRQVVLQDAAGKPLATLTVGSEVKGKANMVYVRGTRNVVLEMDSARLTDLPQKVEDVLDRPPPPPPPPPTPAADGGSR
ncbi:MAG TPA: DUF4340 domain-containing protein [Myxococcaceae bacterium]|nr:DUF4340 domain-containing protein [Myxococcaceae bacterium]